MQSTSSRYATSNQSTSRGRPAQPRNQDKRLKALVRIVTNLATFNAIVFVTLVAIVLTSIGFFYQEIILHDISVDATSLEEHAQACKIDINGFINGTCQPNEIATTTKDAWTAIGQLLALQWQATMSSPYFVSTCVKTKPTNSRQIALVLLAGYDHFPLCQPSNGPQEIAGMAMLETTVRDEFPNGVFMLTVFADKTMTESVVHVNSDGSTDHLIANINRNLIDTNGSNTTDYIGINAYQYFMPLGQRYKVSTYSVPVVLDITDRIDPTTVVGWNVGRVSKRAVIVTWIYHHETDHRHEIACLQLLFLLTGVIFVAGDFYLTVQGLKGFLAHRPVMTFDLTAGLERRATVVFMWACSFIFALTYPDVICVYHGSTSILWFFVTILLGACFSCIACVLLSLVSRLPSPFTHVVTISCNSMNIVYPVLELVHMSQLSGMLEQYRQSPIKLGLNISGTIRSSGAYDNDNSKSALAFILPILISVIFGCVFVSILVATYFHRREYGTYLLNLDLARTNGFVTHCGVPNWITGLPLAESNMIKIGNKLFCKPSIQATLGYATIVPLRKKIVTKKSQTSRTRTRRASSCAISMSEKEENESFVIVSVYNLLSIVLSFHLWLPNVLRPRMIGIVEKNQFTPTSTKTIEKEAFMSHRGACTN